MSRGIVLFILFLAIVAGGLFFLSGNVDEVPQQTMEEEVSLGADAEG